MIGTTGSRGLFLIRDHAPRVHLVLVLLSQAGEIVDVKKKIAVLKRAMIEKRERWQNRQSPWQQPAREDGGQNSHDTWKKSQLQGMWKEISAETDAVGTTCERKDKYVEQKL